MNQSSQDRFDEALKTWAERPPRLAAQEATEKVIERTYLDTRRSSWAVSFPGFAAAAAGMILVIAISWALLVRPEAPPPEVDLALPPLDDHVVLVWLDPETPLYLTVATPAMEGDS